MWRASVGWARRQGRCCWYGNRWQERKPPEAWEGTGAFRVGKDKLLVAGGGLPPRAEAVGAVLAVGLESGRSSGVNATEGAMKRGLVTAGMGLLGEHGLVRSTGLRAGGLADECGGLRLWGDGPSA